METKNGPGWNRDQSIAFGGMLLLTVAVGASVWYHLTRAAGAVTLEFVILIPMFALLLVMTALYAMRMRWSYVPGILVCLGFFAMLGKGLQEHVVFFSLSLYNVLVLLTLLMAVVEIVFSIRAMRGHPPTHWWHAGLGVLGIALVAVAVAWVTDQNSGRITEWNSRLAMKRVQVLTVDIEDLDGKIEALMDEGDIPSLAAAIVVDDEIVWIRGYGEGNTLDKMHDIGSITKPFVATAVLQLYERGLIDLDDDVSQYLPFNVCHPDYPDVPITIHMLLAHRSCLAHNNNPYMSYLMGPSLRQWSVETLGWEYYKEFETITYPEFMAGYLDPDSPYYQPATWANCRPGSDYIYSTPGYDLLGYLVEKVSGQPFNDYLHENIFAPLRMTNTTATPLDNPEGMAVPYERINGVLAKTNVQLPLTQRRRIGGGSLYSTVADLANFLTAHMNQGAFEGHQLLQPETVALMHRPTRTSGGDFMQIGYGYGWGIYKKTPQEMWGLTFQPRGYQGHGGSYWGYNSLMFMVEEEHGAYGVVLLTNTGHVGKADWPWHFGTRLNIGNLILGEAYQMYQDSLNQ